MNITDRLTEVYKQKYDDIVRMYKSRAGIDDVEDLVQEGFYRALLYKDSFNEKFITIENWLVSIFNNCLRDLLREKRDGKSMHVYDDEELLCNDRCPAEEELEAKIIKDIEKKRGDTRQILWLYFVMGCKNEEIQRIVGGSYKNVDSATQRFKEYCRNRYGHLMRD